MEEKTKKINVKKVNQMINIGNKILKILFVLFIFLLIYVFLFCLQLLHILFYVVY